MARGWESQSIEEQQAEASQRNLKAGSPLSPEKRAQRRQIEGLELSRARAVQQLAAATNPRHRKMLEESLLELERRIRELSQG
jgi:hypothetical protein